jgi:hypothetical protein
MVGNTCREDYKKQITFTEAGYTRRTHWFLQHATPAAMLPGQTSTIDGRKMTLKDSMPL